MKKYVKIEQLFGILDKDGKYIVNLSENGEYNSSYNIKEAAKLKIVKLEEWLKIIDKYKIEYKVKAFSTQDI